MLAHRERARDLRAARHDRSLPRRAARQRDRGAVDRHQPGEGEDRRVRAVGRDRRPRRRAARDEDRASRTRPTTATSSASCSSWSSCRPRPRTVEGAINAGIAFVLLPYILSEWLGVSQSWAFILFGLGAIQYARHPEGTLENGKRQSMAFFQRQIDRLAARRAGPSLGDGVRDGGAPDVRRQPGRGGVVSVDEPARGRRGSRSGSRASPRSTTCRSTSRRASRSGSSARTARARRRSSTACSGCCGPTRAGSCFGGRDITRLPGVPAGPARLRPHVPAHRAVRGHDGARPPARRRAGPARHRPVLEGRAQPLEADRATRTRAPTARSSCSGSRTSPTARSRR